MSQKRILVIMSGIHCSGKSYLTSIMIQTFSDHNIFIIERDEIFGQIILNNPGIGSNKKNKLITEKMRIIYEQFNESENSILIVDSCSGGDGVKEFIMQKAEKKTQTIVINFIPKMNNNVLDIEFYLKRASERPPHYVFPTTVDKQIKELEKCYSQWTFSKDCDKWNVIDLTFDWNLNDIIEKFRNFI